MILGLVETSQQMMYIFLKRIQVLFYSDQRWTASYYQACELRKVKQVGIVLRFACQILVIDLEGPGFSASAVKCLSEQPSQEKSETLARA